MKKIKMANILNHSFFKEKNVLKYIVHLIMFAALLSGCAAPLTYRAQQSDEPVISENSYYYFTEAQLMKISGDLDMAALYMNKALQINPESLYLKKDLATIYLHQRKIDEGLGLVESILESSPNDVDGLIMLGSIKLTQNQNEEAINAYEKVLENDPKQQSIYLYLGNLYTEEENLEKAEIVYGKMVQNYPESYLGYFFLGKIYVKQGKRIEAEKEFRKTIAFEDKLIEPRFELLQLYGAVEGAEKDKKTKRKKIITIYKDILELYPKNIRASMELGYYYQKNGMTQESEAIFKDLGIRSTTDTGVIRKVIRLFMDQKNFDAAVIILEGMLKGAPESSEIYYVKGVAYDGLKNKKSAIFYFKLVKPDSRFFQNATVHIAYLYKEQGKTEAAIEHLKDVISTVPGNEKTGFILYLAAIYEEIEQYKEAEVVLKQGIEIEPNNPKLHFRLGVVYDKWGRKEDSITEMKTVINLDPNDAHALNYLGYTYADMGLELDEAERLLKKALELKPDDGYITDSLGWVYFKKGMYDEAITILEKAVEKVPDDPIILEHLGDAYSQINKREKALEYYKRSLSKKKEDKEALEDKIKQMQHKE